MRARLEAAWVGLKKIWASVAVHQNVRRLRPLRGRARKREEAPSICALYILIWSACCLFPEVRVLAAPHRSLAAAAGTLNNGSMCTALQFAMLAAFEVHYSR